ncbi:MAG TPA: SDR family NAD(P)-dependent oxidoreductase, partial [Phycisphaerales bacterium]|nr:SDR family NAD(P)-dependent oxidoreductase [Phycisphaerales bacterium]
MSEASDAAAFAGRHVVVTGGAGALGSAVVRGVLAGGGVVSIPVADGTHDAALRGLELELPLRVKVVHDIDLSAEEATRRFYDEAVEAHGTPWAVVNSAGGFAMAELERSDLGALTELLRTNLVSCFLSCREAVRRMRAAGGGRIVNVAARPALEPRLGAKMTAYTASKAAVAGFTCALAEEVVGHGILVNAVAPSVMDTPANRAAMPQADFSTWARTEQVAA